MSAGASSRLLRLRRSAATVPTVCAGRRARRGVLPARARLPPRRAPARSSCPPLPRARRSGALRTADGGRRDGTSAGRSLGRGVAGRWACPRPDRSRRRRARRHPSDRDRAGDARRPRRLGQRRRLRRGGAEAFGGAEGGGAAASSAAQRIRRAPPRRGRASPSRRLRSVLRGTREQARCLLHVLHRRSPARGGTGGEEHPTSCQPRPNWGRPFRRRKSSGSVRTCGDRSTT